MQRDFVDLIDIDKHLFGERIKYTYKKEYYVAFEFCHKTNVSSRWNGFKR